MNVYKYIFRATMTIKNSREIVLINHVAQVKRQHEASFHEPFE